MVTCSSNRKNEPGIDETLSSELQSQVVDLKLYEDLAEAADSPESVGRLILYGQDLNEFPPEILSMINLTELNLGGNFLENIPEDVSLLTRLKTLKLFDNRFKTFPRPICRLKNLQTLYLQENQIAEIPDEIGLLQNLQELDLGQNRIRMLNNGIWTLKNLKHLNMQDNSIEGLPDDIRGLESILSLNLSNNILSILPAVVSVLPNLSSINLSSNAFTEIPQALYELQNIAMMSFLPQENMPGVKEIVYSSHTMEGRFAAMEWGDFLHLTVEDHKGDLWSFYWLSDVEGDSDIFLAEAERADEESGLIGKSIRVSWQEVEKNFSENMGGYFRVKELKSIYLIRP